MMHDKHGAAESPFEVVAPSNESMHSRGIIFDALETAFHRVDDNESGSPSDFDVFPGFRVANRVSVFGRPVAQGGILDVGPNRIELGGIGVSAYHKRLDEPEKIL